MLTFTDIYCKETEIMQTLQVTTIKRYTKKSPVKCVEKNILKTR